MKKLLLITGMIFFLIFGNISTYAQSISFSPADLIIGPVLVGTSSTNGAHSFLVTGSGYSAGAELYVDSYDSRLKVSKTGLSGSYNDAITYNADGSGNVNQLIYIKYTPNSIGQILFNNHEIELWDLESFTWKYKNVRGIGSGPEILIQGREQAPDNWLEIVSGTTTPAVNQGTDFGDALAGTSTVDKTYRIMNTKTGGYAGNLVLDEYATGKYVQITGADADQFSVTVEPSSPIAKDSATTTFTVRFEPTSAGIKTAMVSIGNNDPNGNEDPYVFTLQGNGTVELPDPPIANAATNIDNNNFFANWTVGGGGITQGYYLDVATDNAFTAFVPGFENKDVGLVTTYNVMGLSPNSDYFYRVRAYNAGGASGNSNTSSLLTAPAVPTVQQATNVSTTSFYANWSFIAGATSYKLDVNTQSDFNGTAIFSNEDVVNTYKFITGLTGGNTYYYRVRSYNGNASEYSATVAAITICNSPIATPATNVMSYEFTANWDAPSGGAPDFYELDVSLSNTFNSFVFGYEGLAVYGTSQVVSGLDPNTTYYYRVSAINVSGSSTFSNTITVTTYAGTMTTWTGAVSTGWNTGGNWSAGVPSAISNVTVPNTANQPVVSMNATCNNLTMDPLTELTVASGNTLTVNGKLLLKASSSGAASLVEFGGLSVSGTQKVQQYISENRWHYVSSPVSDAIADVFYDIYLRYYDEANSAFVYIVDTNTTTYLTPGVGFTAWSDDFYLGNTTVTYEGGDINSGAVNIPVTNNGDGWNLGGNPYPAAIDWDDASWVKTNIDGSVYVWDGIQYLTWNGSVGSLTDGIIPAMQSYFVKASGANPALQVNDAAKVHGPDAYKAGDVENLIKVSIFGNGYKDVTYINFDENSTAGFDSQYDSYKLFGIEAAPQIFSIVGDDLLSINVLPDFYPGMVIPLGYKASASGEYIIKVSNLSSFDKDINLYIEDLYTGSLTELTDNSEYTFQYNETDQENRFALHFMTTTGVDETALQNISVYSYDKSVFVTNDPANFKKGTIGIYNISGQEVLSTELQPVSINKIDLVVDPGYYVVKVITGTEMVTQKVLIK